jgi:hypothetical protein
MEKVSLSKPAADNGNKEFGNMGDLWRIQADLYLHLGMPIFIVINILS